MTRNVKQCSGCGNDQPEYITQCKYCGTDKCNLCDVGDDVECGNCEPEEDE